jgi:hypothetical protein
LPGLALGLRAWPLPKRPGEQAEDLNFRYYLFAWLLYIDRQSGSVDARSPRPD